MKVDDSEDVERALRESEARLRSILESAPNIIITAARDGTIQFVNRVLPVTASPEDVIGTSIYDHVLPADRSRVSACVDEVLETGQVSSYEIRTPSIYGDRLFSVHVGPVRVGEEIVGVTLVTWDITERIELQARLMASDRLASVGLIAASVAHEVNNPATYALVNLRWVSDSLRGAGDTSSRTLGERVDRAVEALERIADIVRDLRNVARDDGREKVGVDVKEVLDTSLRIAQHEIDPRARIVREYGDVPIVRVSDSRLGQVFVNLLVNAAQAIPSGKPEGNEVRVTTRTDEGGNAVIEIADTGSGIPPELVHRIFDPFVSTKPHDVGTGLGLFLCNRMIAAMGGELSVLRSGDDGTVMRVSLPTARHTPREAAVVSTTPSAT